MKLLDSFAFFCLLGVLPAAVPAQPLAGATPWSQRVAHAAVARWPAGRIAPASPPSWTHDQASVLAGLEAVWLNTVDPVYFDFIRASVDPLVGADGSLPTLPSGTLPLVDFQLGEQLMLLYGVTQDQRYFQAATTLYNRFATQPRNAAGGFWQSGKNPNQMTPDGIDEDAPFYAEYAATFHHPEAFADITRQFVTVHEHLRDPHGLLHQDWDPTLEERWANRQTGMSAEAWGRGMAWYLAALVESLPFYPQDDPGRAQLLQIFEADAASAARYQDAHTGLWYQILDKAGAPGNFPEASASCLFVYAFAKGVRLGYLPAHYLENAQRAYTGILHHFVQTGPGASVTLTGTVEATDLGGQPYHDGSYAYYTSEKTLANDPKGVGTFLLASTEMENAPNASLGRDATVTVDAWFNSQQRADPTGRQVYYHYKWDDWSPSGFSLFGHIFENYGAHLSTLDSAPTVAGLRNTQVYIVASPDNSAKNPHPHYANAEDAAEIAAWVKSGGVLVIMENDTSFADLDHFNLVAEKFGIHFNSVLRKHVIGTQWQMGQIIVAGDGPIFRQPHTLYMKDVCTISVTPPAQAALTDQGDILMATAKYGRGTVFAVVDPWLYNEYTDGRKLPVAYDNYAAGRELVRWLLDQVPHS
jgi:unsaturated rhamnogalacturonyl hydrolase